MLVLSAWSTLDVVVVGKVVVGAVEPDVLAIVSVLVVLDLVAE